MNSCVTCRFRRYICRFWGSSCALETARLPTPATWGRGRHASVTVSNLTLPRMSNTV